MSIPSVDGWRVRGVEPPMEAQATDGRGRAVAIGPEALADALPSLVHDMRGVITALTAFAHLLAEREDLTDDDVAQTCLQGVKVNADSVAFYLEVLDLLQAASSPQLLPLGAVVRQSASRLEPLLGRVGATLNLPGSFPDTSVERRCLGAVLETLVRYILKFVGQAGNVRVVLSVAMTDSSTVLTLRTEAASKPGAGAALADWLQALADSAEVAGLVLRTAVERLGARMSILRGPGNAALVLVAIPSRAPGRPAGPGPA